MATREAPVAGSIILVILAIACAIVVTRWSSHEVGFCRSTFTTLASGQTSAHRLIDWSHLQALDINVGATYRGLPNDAARRDYERAFIRNFAIQFQQAGGTPAGLTNWRLQARTPARVTVAADTKQKTLLLSIPASGTKKLVAIQWQ